MNVIVVEGQNIIDLTQQHTGGLNFLAYVCNDNGIYIGEELTPGQVILIKDEYIEDTKLSRVLSSTGNRISTNESSFQNTLEFRLMEDGTVRATQNNLRILE